MPNNNERWFQGGLLKSSLEQLSKLKSISLSRALKDSSWVLFGQSGAFFGQLALISTAASLLKVNEYGDFSIMLIFALLFDRTLMTVHVGISRFYCEAYQDNKIASYWLACLSILRRVSLICIFITGLFFVVAMFGRFYLTSKLLLIFGFFVVASGLNTAFMGILLSARKRGLYALMQLADPWLKVFFLLLFSALNISNILSLSFAYLVSSLVLSITNGCFVHQLIDSILGPQYKDLHTEEVNSASIHIWSKTIWSFTRPFIIWGIFAWLHQSSDRLSLDFFEGPTQVGYFSVIFQIGFIPMLLLSNMIDNLISPIIYSRFSGANKLTLGSYDKKLLTNLPILCLSLLTVLGVFLTSVWNYQFMSLILEQRYLMYSYLLPYLVLSGGLTAIAQSLCTRILAAKRPNDILFVKIAYPLVALSLNIFGAYLAGVSGVVYATLFSSLFYVFLLVRSLQCSKYEYVDS